MEEAPNIDLTSIIVSVATAAVEANRILSEGTEAPMGITEFKIQYQVHASLHIPVSVSPPIGLRPIGGGMVTLGRPAIRSAQLRHFTTLSPRERILTGYLGDADLTITTTMEPLPRVS